MISTRTTVLALLVVLASRFLYRLLCNLFLHPLNIYPGPKLNAVTKLPYINQILRGTAHVYIRALHEKYGDIVRITPEELSYSCDAWRDIYGHRTGGRESFAKDLSFVGPDMIGSNGIMRAQGDTNHARIRKVFSHAFSDRALKDQAPIFQGYVDQLVGNIRKILHEDEKARIPISDLYNFLTFDIMGDLTFGEPLGLLTDGKYSTWVASVFGSIQLVIVSRILRWYPWLNGTFQALLPRSIKEKRQRTVSHTVDCLDKRLARGETDRPDIWTCVMKHKEEDRLTYPEMQSSASTFMIAGTETTATLLSGLTFLLLKHPDVLEKLVREVRNTFSTADDIDISSLARLEYLNACIEEALRIYPPAPIGFPRVVPKHGAFVGGQPVPAGISLAVSPFAAFHSEKNFHLADQFIPERWLGDPRFGSDKRSVLQPFSYGPRNCLGKNLAYHEMRLAMTKVLYNFDLVNLCEESQDWMNQKVFGVWQKPKLMVQLKERTF
ncbi:cytochrome P450 [Macrophomina phaseolina]|uniref:Cytochrome P450 n=1 Tax=Macrophomina phaseolina TaxID=35725 RepID=A0ABQ8GP92_9PEZI|nr:cytochrome P450 [Macrophomina phaseolina]